MNRSNLTSGEFFPRLSYKKALMHIFFADLFVEAAVVGIVCFIFLILFVVAGIRQILKDRE